MLHKWYNEEMPNKFSTQQKRSLFIRFIEDWNKQEYSVQMKSLVIKHIIIPIFTHAFDNNQHEKLILGEINDNVGDIVALMIERIIDKKLHGNSDALLIQLFKFLCLLVDKGSQYIEDVNNKDAKKKHGSKLRSMITFAWPYLIPRNSVDPATKYYGHLLLAYIISKFTINRKIVLQTFYSLLKAHSIEAKQVVKQALDVIIPTLPTTANEQGVSSNKQFLHWSRKVLVEEGHTLSQLMHVLAIIVRHQKIYYPANSSLIKQMVASMQRLGFSTNANREQRKLAVDIAEVLIKWEARKMNNDKESNKQEGSIKMEVDQSASSNQPSTSSDSRQPDFLGLEKKSCNNIVNFLLVLAVQGTEVTQGHSNDHITRRCMNLLSTSYHNKLWGDQIDFNLGWMEKILLNIETTNNITMACIAIEVLAKFVSFAPKNTVLQVLKTLERGILTCVQSTQIKVVSQIQKLLSIIFYIHPQANQNQPANERAGSSTNERQAT